MNIWNNKVKAAVLFVGIVCVLYGTRPIFPEAYSDKTGRSYRPTARGMSVPAYGIDPRGFQGTIRELQGGQRGMSEPMTGGGGGY